MKNKYLVIFSFIIIFILGYFIGDFTHFVKNDKPTNTLAEYNSKRYELVRINDNNVILLDNTTGKCWRKFIDTAQGPSKWTEEDIYNIINSN